MKTEDLKDPSWVLNHAAHELRGPLATIIGFAQLLQKNPREMEKLETYLGYILEKSLQMQGILDGVLDLSRYELGKPIRMEMSHQGIAAVLTSVVPEVEKQYPDCRFSTEIQDAGLFFDPRRLKALVTLVMDNACKYSGGTGRVSLRGSKDKKFYVLEVTDQGPGILPENLELVCEPFFSADSPNGVGKGAGLGLALARLYAQLMGAQLEIRSKPGQGTTVELRFTI